MTRLFRTRMLLCLLAAALMVPVYGYGASRRKAAPAPQAPAPAAAAAAQVSAPEGEEEEPSAPAAAATAAISTGRRAGLGAISKDPYIGAVVVDAATGKTLFEDNADATVYPASVVKLMNLLLVLEKIEAGALRFDEKITVTAEVAHIGGSQVFLKENEMFRVDDLLYALIVQSANDAATALAIHLGGSREGFVDMMNARAKQLGMKFTMFNSVHGLPPSRGQQPDVTTPRDISLLALELLKHSATLRYSSVRVRTFRQDEQNPFIMQTHNHLLGVFDGCDGLKTGYFRAAGYSIAATALRHGHRVVAVVMGSRDRKGRDSKASELLNRGLSALDASGAPAWSGPTIITPVPPPQQAAAAQPEGQPAAASGQEAAPAAKAPQAATGSAAAQASSPDGGHLGLWLGLSGALNAVLIGLVIYMRTARTDTL